MKTPESLQEYLALSPAEKLELHGILKPRSEPKPLPSDNLPAVASNALLAACRFITEKTGTCPHDDNGWEQPKGCENVCNMGCETECWIAYFESVAANPSVHPSGGASPTVSGATRCSGS